MITKRALHERKEIRNNLISMDTISSKILSYPNNYSQRIGKPTRWKNNNNKCKVILRTNLRMGLLEPLDQIRIYIEHYGHIWQYYSFHSVVDSISTMLWHIQSSREGSNPRIVNFVVIWERKMEHREHGISPNLIKWYSRGIRWCKS